VVQLRATAPVTAGAVTRYGQAGSDIERRHIALVEAVRVGLAAQLTMDAQPVAPVAADEATASGWCSFKRGDAAGEPGVYHEFMAPAFAWRFPDMPDTGHADLRRGEAWAASHPQDPELPWLLRKRYAGCKWANKTPYFY